MMAVGSWTVAGASNATAAPSKGATPTSSGIITDNWEREEAFELPWDGAARDGAREGSLEPTWQKKRKPRNSQHYKTNQPTNKQTNKPRTRQASKQTNKLTNRRMHKRKTTYYFSVITSAQYMTCNYRPHTNGVIFQNQIKQTNTMVGFLF